MEAAKPLIEAVAEAGLELALPRGIPTYCHSITKCWTRLDHVFISEESLGVLITCNTLTDHRGINTDHIPILTELNLGVAIKAAKPIPNFKDVDWDKFCKTLVNFLGPAQLVEQITSQRQLDKRCSSLTEAIQNMIREQVPVTAITSKSKHWWTRELIQMQKQANLSGRQSFLYCNEPEHAVHIQYKVAKKRYVNRTSFFGNHHLRGKISPKKVLARVGYSL